MLRRPFLRAICVVAVLVPAVEAIEVMTWMHDNPGGGFAVAIVVYGTSGFTFVPFFWIPWTAWRIAPPSRRYSLALAKLRGVGA